MTTSDGGHRIGDRPVPVGPPLRTLLGRVATEIRNRNRKWTVALAGERGGIGPALDFIRFRTLDEAVAWIHDIESQQTSETISTTFLIPVHIDTHKEFGAQW